MYRVEWLPVAGAELAALYDGADEATQAALSAAFDAILVALTADPHTAGEGREPPRRILFVNPLSVVFRADFRARVVTILRVRRYRGPEQG